MRQESESSAEFHVYAILGVLPVFWGVVFFVMAAVLPEQILSQLQLDIGLCVTATIPLLIVSAMMLEQAFVARRKGDASE